MINDKRCIFCNWLNREVGDSYTCENCNKQSNTKEIEVEVEDNDWYKELTKIKGIGKETAEDIGRIYSSIDDLKKALENDRIPLRNDVVEKLKSNLNTVKRRY